MRKHIKKGRRPYLFEIKMKPFHTLLFILVVFLLFSGLMLIFPKDGISLSDEYSLQFVTWDEFFSLDTTKSVDISGILDGTTIDFDSVEFVDSKLGLDSAMIGDSVVVYYKPVPIKVDSVIRYLEFPNGNKQILFSFFELLANIKNTQELVRVMHYGDSQVEADRITSYLRYKLQSQFGGSGAGLLPSLQPYNFKSPMITENSDNRKRYTAFGRKDTTVLHRRYGVLASFSRFAPFYEIEEIVEDTNQVDLDFLTDSIFKSNTDYSAWVRFSESNYSYSNVKNFSQVKLLYGYNQEPVQLKVYTGEDELISEQQLSANDAFSIKGWTFEHTPKQIKFEFSGKDSPDIYGISFQSSKGIIVDNIGMRGASGTMFTRMDAKQLAEMYRYLNAKLLILQFGGNVVPGMLENYNFYKRNFGRQLKRLKELIPGVTIIVIGLADMSMKEKDEYVSFPNITIIRDALKEATFEAGFPYWDMYEAMGGANSMPSWVFADPSLAEKDFTHFNPRGSNIIAKMFYNAFMFEYNQYLKKNKTFIEN